jgi:UTP--glucose-1-phosphate uridylyltransferase
MLTIIPAAGYGTRLLPGTKSIPKEMFPIVDSPAIEYIAREIKECGLKDLLIITAHNKDSIVDYFDKAFELEAILKEKGKQILLKKINEFNDMNIVTVRQKEQLGLGHAIYMGATLVGDRPFIVSLPDMLIMNGGHHMSNMLELYHKYNKGVIALMRVPVNETNKYGIIDGIEKEGIIFIHDMVEKPAIGKAPTNFAILGRYILPNKTMFLLEKTQPGAGGEIQLTDALREIANTDGLIGYICDDEVYDTGSHIGFIKANIAFGLKNPELRDDIIQFMKEKLI